MSINEINYDSIGVIVRELRMKDHLSQEELAEHMEISVSHIRNIEKSNAKVSLRVIVRLANFFQVPLDYIMKDSIHNKTVSSEYTHSSLWDGCNEIQTQIILDTATSLKESLLKTNVKSSHFHPKTNTSNN